MTIMFDVVGEIQGKARPRMTRTGHVYTPDKTVAYENRIRREYLEKCALPPTDEPVTVWILMYCKPAQSLSKKKRVELMKKAPMKKPDIDNVAKVVLDALNKVAWVDDKQVTSLRIFRTWAEEDEEEKITVKIVRR